MSEFGCRIRPYVESEILAAREALNHEGSRTSPSRIWSVRTYLDKHRRLEHVRVHWHMLLWVFVSVTPGEAWDNCYASSALP